MVDLQSGSMVCNESGDIVRMLNEFRLHSSGGDSSGGDSSGGDSSGDGARMVDLYPAELAREIDETNAWVYELVNNGVYRGTHSGARTQD